MINPENYLSKIAAIDISSMPMPLQKGHEFLMKATSNATDWNTYNNSTAIRKTIQLYFERLAEFITTDKKLDRAKKVDEKRRQTDKEIMQEAMRKQGLIDKNGNKINSSAQKNKVAKDVFQPTMVERMPEELRFIKRYVNLNGKTKTKDEILRFITCLNIVSRN